MVTTTATPQAKPGVRLPGRETVLTPRFYTTDFKAAAKVDLSAQQTELEAMRDEMKADYNRNHFVRGPEFDEHWQALDEATQTVFLEYLERSCLSEFSGFLLFKELSRALKKPQPLLAEILHYMARDEARHAGFLNKAMGDFRMSLELPSLSRQRTFTWFPFSWVLYTVYLSEKIGYWRYILIHRQLVQRPEYRFNPLFNYFESWCQDENRHGDIFKALILAQPRLWNNGWAHWWIRFFLLSVFVTHTLTVQERHGFYESLGFNAEDYNREVIRQTNATSARTFPVVLDVDNPQFWDGLEQIKGYAEQLRQPGNGWLRQQRLKLGLCGGFLRLMALPVRPGLTPETALAIA